MLSAELLDRVKRSAILSAQFSLGSTLLLTSYFFYEVFSLLLQGWRSPQRKLDGPPSHSLVFGHMQTHEEQEFEGRLYPAIDAWRRQYGPIFRTKSFMGENRCMLFDPRALAHVLGDSKTYAHSTRLNYVLKAISGEGLLVTEGELHRRQRKMMSPAFSSQHLRELVPIMLAKSAQLRDMIMNDMRSAASGTPTRIDILPLLSYNALDIIGLAGFSYHFNALSSGPEASELSHAFQEVFGGSAGMGALIIVKAFMPLFRLITFDKRNREMEKSKSTMRRIGLDLIQRKKDAIQSSHKDEDIKEKDLLSLLVRSNLDGAEGQTMSDEQIADQIPTFLVAGHETTATALSWCLFALSQNQDIQTKLRNELRAVAPLSRNGEEEDKDGVKISMDQLDSLQYLDAVVKESLRMYPPVENAFREATRDDCIPVEKPFKDGKGRVKDSIEVKKADIFMISMITLNRMEEIWGEDANQFRPERWLDGLPSTHSKFGGGASQNVWGWGGSMTFLSGQRSCIGFKFAVLEMKAVLFQLVRELEFELAVPVEDIGKTHMIVSRPAVKSEISKGNQLPLNFRLAP